MERHSLSTTQASKQLQEDLNIHFGIGKKIVGHFFNFDYSDGRSTYWVEKPNYSELVRNNPTITDIKNRVKGKVQKFWKKPLNELLPNPRDRQNLYMSIYMTRLMRKKSTKPLPNALLLEELVKKLGHWSPFHKGAKTSVKRKEFLTTNQARKMLMDEMNTYVSPDLKTIKKYFDLMSGQDKKGVPKKWLRNNKAIDEKDIVPPSNGAGGYVRSFS